MIAEVSHTVYEALAGETAEETATEEPSGG
jgi:hypothetical protein